MSSGAPSEAAERAEPQPLEPRRVGTAQLTSEACAASKPVPEGNVSQQQLVLTGKLLNPGLLGIEPNAPQLAATAPSWTGSTGPPGTRNPASA